MEALTPKSSAENLRVISFESVLSSSSGHPIVGTERSHNLLYNCTQITEKQVQYLIEMDMYEFDSRVVDLTDEQLKFLRNKEVTEDDVSEQQSAE